MTGVDQLDQAPRFVLAALKNPITGETERRIAPPDPVSLERITHQFACSTYCPADLVETSFEWLPAANDDRRTS